MRASWERRLRFLLEWIHAPLIFALACPLLYAFMKEREEQAVYNLFLAGLFCVICSAASHYAARRMQTLSAYLVICALAGAASLAAVWTLGGALLREDLQIGAFVSASGGCALMIIEACLVRMREKSRKRAREENDISWVDSFYFLERPRPDFLVWFALGYAIGFLNNSAALCNVSLGAGILYLAIYLLHRHLRVNEQFMKDVSGLDNVPAGKIRRLRAGMITGLLVLLGAGALPSFLTAGQRSYRDLRFREFSHVVRLRQPQSRCLWIRMYRDFVNRIMRGEIREPPLWLNIAWGILSAFCLLLFAYLVVLAVRACFLAFRGRMEENGDIVRSIEKDEVTKLKRERRRILPIGLTEQERIRQRYRRIILRYRKDRPKESETPLEIEQGTALPDTISPEELHTEYERARYGRQEG